MRALNELVIRGPGADVAFLRQRLESNLTNGWRRDHTLEERLCGMSVGGGNALCFSCADGPERPAAALWLQARSPEEWHVSNIVPLKRRDLSDAEYNHLLEEFKTTFLEPRLEGTAVHPEIVQARTRLEDYLSWAACRRFREFSSAADRYELRPDDHLRWRTFLIQAHRDNAAFDAQTLEEWLEAEGWPKEQRGQLIHEYDSGRALLASYDEEQSR
jgi:hypothetical protein